MCMFLHKCKIPSCTLSQLNHNDVLSNSQYGFRAGYSCSTQLISLIEDLNSHMDHNLQVDIRLFKGI